MSATNKFLNIDERKAEAFADKMVDILNHGAVTLMVSLGHRTGLFDTMAKLPPATSGQIAKTADLNERYVREWLGAMVTGGIIEYDPNTRAYHLPSEHAACLTRAATPDHIAGFAQYIPLLGSVEDDIAHCFQHGGGVPYSKYPRFHQVMAEDSGQTVVGALTDAILPLVPGLVEELHRGINALDVGCGSGRALHLMAKTFPRSRFTGYDFSEEAISSARAVANREGLDNLNFKVKDAAAMNEIDQYDFVTAFDAIHDQKEPATVLSQIATALRPQGIFLMQDIAGSSHVHNNLDHPIGPLLYTISCMHCMSVSLAQGGDGLGTMWGKEKALEMLRHAGFGHVVVEQLAHDIQNYYYIARKSNAVQP